MLALTADRLLSSAAASVEDETACPQGTLDGAFPNNGNRGANSKQQSILSVAHSITRFPNAYGIQGSGETY
ncbi:hypothetical protein H112_07861 [Trichophyton rubrum D6]|uniref:Uncharacterized protein n=1 Tax=Trichophyton rubrum CBS 288.86 TaxID=1215330 RepID=A0A022VR14_TRIRU|nr:hypothetical protein H100_07888 [Trichophyton rubrum MR850]EZF37810.1 hypothetical protein H102_07848 [Trichophyton rubrum CBS 100081]EZF48471.1 hypothetical protein H103_07873 [Trichophyton rubrum CBS 288.86]EZF59073.1 hypothetical protein H104_07820 [Trichophyton rubrum CBS 289.86]EZF91084.1 hypothetical protein H113_07931 [Trichophyton rubrum MR1459]EZG12646.1 hypothetical protein H107_08012 [Trichophyton rubrum CBS 202.88]KDB29584.1 hypothetical protein H112_07861 [Trichophyton rubrum 